MSSRILSAIAGLVAGAAAMGSAVSSPRGQATRTCHVTGGEKLPPTTGIAGICSAVERAMASKAPTLRYNVEVRVLSASALSATIVAEGKKLPEQHFAVSDRNLYPGAIERFAVAIAEVAKAG